MPSLRRCAAVAVVLASSPAVVFATSVTTSSTWVVNRVNGNDLINDGSEAAPFMTLGRALANTLLAAGDTVMVDGLQFPVPAPYGFDPDEQNFAPIPVRINMTCRDVPFGYLNGNLKANADGVVMHDCRLYAHQFEAGTTNAHKFYDVTFDDLGWTGGSTGNYFQFDGTGANYEFHNLKVYNANGIHVSGALSGGHIVTDSTFNHSYYPIYADGGASFLAVQYNVFNDGSQAFSAPQNGTPDYRINFNYYSNISCCYGASRGPSDVSGGDPQILNAGNMLFSLAATSPVINIMMDSTSGLPRTPGCCGVGVQHGPGLDTPFNSQWQTWTGTAWVPVTTVTSPVMIDGNGNLELQSSALNGFVRSSEVVAAVPTQTLASFRLDRTAYTGYASGKRADTDNNVTTPRRELGVRSLACGKGFADDPTATFVTTYSGTPLSPPLPGPCWQAQIRIGRNLP